MEERAAELIRLLKLEPHPEGGYYREIFRSGQKVQPEDGRPRRTALTTIFFLLCEAQVSRWHRVASDEIWHWYEGSALELFQSPRDVSGITRIPLGAVEGSRLPVHTIPAGDWQAARSSGAYTLVGCSVGPGFDFADFRFLRDEPALSSKMKGLGKEYGEWI